MAEKLADGLWRFTLGLVPPLEANAYLLDRDGEVTLIDTGLPSFLNSPSLLDALADVGYEPGDVDRVLLTHYDLDHVGGVSHLHPAFEGPTYLGRDDARLVRGDHDPSWGHHKAAFHRIARRFVSLPDGVDVREVTDGDRIDGFTAYHTPGHNPGHTVYVHDSGVAFLGDLVWGDDGSLTTPFWLDSYDMRQVRRSVVNLADDLPDFEVAAMGHGEPIRTGGRRALSDLAARL